MVGPSNKTAMMNDSSPEGTAGGRDVEIVLDHYHHLHLASRFSNVDETYVDETYLPRQQPYDVNSTTQLDHDTIDRIYTNFEEDLEYSQEVQEDEFEETPPLLVRLLHYLHLLGAIRAERPKRSLV
ncbi:hypothetical protein HAX54_053524 [Datura stramonium]|uniref:Uncharacterized protein n=1 Tax=Datura stramonium TaxID=4076 RepID=A0ABS8WTF5_DATST|nr:hypothetical protein [Datura stramonium]